MKEAAPSKPPLRELSPLPPTVYIHVCVDIGQEGGSGESTFRVWQIEKTNTGLPLSAGCPVFRYSKRPANMTEAFCRITICPDKSKSHAYPDGASPAQAPSQPLTGACVGESSRRWEARREGASFKRCPPFEVFPFPSLPKNLPQGLTTPAGCDIISQTATG